MPTQTGDIATRQDSDEVSEKGMHLSTFTIREFRSCEEVTIPLRPKPTHSRRRPPVTSRNTAVAEQAANMPGIEKRFPRHAQLYSRVGFAHHYRPLAHDELTFVLTRHWHTLGLDLSDDDFTDAQAIAAIARITSGNFRLLQRLFTQIRRIMRINELTTITADVV